MDVSSIKKEPNIALILGNEARGMSEAAEEFVDLNLYIKMQNTESLNVSVAGSILMYELTKKC
jgi:TrmH family RNA methyltransferase